MSKTIRIGLIGVGGFGRVHLESIDVMASEGLACLSAVADPSMSVVSAKQPFEMRGVATYSDYRCLLSSGDIDLVVISTPIPLHEEMARAAIAAGLQVYLEKPPVPTIQQLRELIALDHDMRVAVGFQMIHNPALLALKRAMLEGRLGTIQSIRAGACWPRDTRYYTRSSWAGRMVLGDGTPVFDGPATNALAHLMHNLLFLGADSEEGFAMPESVEGGFFRARPIESYDAALITGMLPRQVKFSMAVAHCCREILPWELHVEGSAGKAILSADGAEFWSSVDIPLSVNRGEVNADRLALYRNLLLWVAGEIPRPSTFLTDCLPYSATTCAALLSSCGVRDVPAHLVETFGKDDGLIFNVHGLHDAVRAMLDGRNLPESVDWFVCGTSVSPASLRHLDLQKLNTRQ
jgi:predicted dehydrogenase